MATIVDIVGSLFISGVVMLAVIALNNGMTASAGRMTHDLVVQENTVELSRVTNYDFTKIGFGVSGDSAIIAADSASITFLADIDDDGNEDSVQYYMGSTDELTSTPNPNDRMLYRVINGETPLSSNLGVTGFDLTYYDASGAETSVLRDIRTIRVSMDVESPYPYTDTTFVKYAGQHWEAYIVPMNIQ